MTLRVEISIIPFGNESKKRVIETVNISNVSFTETTEIGYDKYVIEHNNYKNYDKDTPRVTHIRQQGALTLARKALERLGF